MSDRDIRTRALALYRGPFRFEQGYVFDADHEVVADDRVPEEFTPPGKLPAIALALVRVRGWGRIGYLKNAGELQDAVGALIAEALTEKWQRERAAKP